MLRFVSKLAGNAFSNAEKGPWLRGLAFAILVMGHLLLGGCGFGAAQAVTEPAVVPGQSSDTASRAEDEIQLPATSAPKDTPASVPTPLQPVPSGPMIYTGEIEPVDEITIVTEVGGHVLEVNVVEGDEVSIGDPLLRVDSTRLEAERAHALAALQVAQAQADLLQVEASDEEIEAARAAVAAAEAIYRAALNGPTEDEITAAEARLFQAEAELRRARAAYDQVAWNPLIAALPETAQLQTATEALAAAQAAYDALMVAASDEEIAIAYADVAATRAAMRRLEDGPEQEQIQAAQAQVRQAETTLYLAQLEMEKVFVRSTVDGIVAQIFLSRGALALPGSPALQLRSQAVRIAFLVEESRLAELKVGQAAFIQVSAYPDELFDGRLTHIASHIDSATRTVQVTVQPTRLSAPLLPGMFATVELAQE